VQEHHDLSHDLLLGPGIGDALGTHGADAGHLSQPVGVGFDYVEHLLSERFHHLLGVDGPDAANHPGAKVFFDALDRRRRGRAQEARLELQAVGVVVNPVARGSDPFAGRDRGGMADDRDQIAMSTRIDPENAEAVVGIVKGDALNKAREHFLNCGFLREGHRRFKQKLFVELEAENSAGAHRSRDLSRLTETRRGLNIHSTWTAFICPATVPPGRVEVLPDH
jgi:hypothetical protein